MKKRSKWMLVGIAALVVAIGFVMVGTGAYFSDQETSNGNNFAAGSLDLNVNGGNTNSVIFNVSNMKPDSQPTGSWTLKNAGSLPGYLDLRAITVTDNENGLLDPESEAGDTTADAGELGSLVNIRLYFDNDKDGYYSTGDDMFYNGKINGLPASFELNKPIAAGADVRINAVCDWWAGANDNLGQTDTTAINFGFQLAQTTAQ